MSPRAARWCRDGAVRTGVAAPQSCARWSCALRCVCVKWRPLIAARAANQHQREDFNDLRDAQLSRDAGTHARFVEALRYHHAEAVREARHQQAGFWTTEVGESNHNLIYLVAYESMADREKKWAAFSTDPEWIQKRGETEKNGPLVMTFSNQFLKPTSFSSVK